MQDNNRAPASEIGASEAARVRETAMSMAIDISRQAIVSYDGRRLIALAGDIENFIRTGATDTDTAISGA